MSDPSQIVGIDLPHVFVSVRILASSCLWGASAILRIAVGSCSDLSSLDNIVICSIVSKNDIQSSFHCRTPFSPVKVHVIVSLINKEGQRCTYISVIYTIKLAYCINTPFWVSLFFILRKKNFNYSIEWDILHSHFTAIGNSRWH